MNDQHLAYPIPPPWIAYPDSEPTWGGWRQGTGQAWLGEHWLPFWNELSLEDRKAYLEQWPPPNEEWRRYVTQVWRR